MPGGQEVWTITKEHAVTIAEVMAEEPSGVCCINPFPILSLTTRPAGAASGTGIVTCRPELLPARRGHTSQFTARPSALQPLTLPVFMAVSLH